MRLDRRQTRRLLAEALLHPGQPLIDAGEAFLHLEAPIGLVSGDEDDWSQRVREAAAVVQSLPVPPGAAGNEGRNRYLQMIDGCEAGPANGSCGTAAYTGRRVIVEDIARCQGHRGLHEGGHEGGEGITAPADCGAAMEGRGSALGPVSYTHLTLPTSDLV